MRFLGLLKKKFKSTIFAAYMCFEKPNRSKPHVCGYALKK